jgi:fructose-bisphosphate aldolase class II
MLLNPTQARHVLAYAAAERFALLAVNADSPSAVQDVLEAARACDAPVIIETSLWQLTSRSFGAGDPVRGMARYLVQLELACADPAFAHLPVLYHTDHIKGPRTLEILGAAIRGVACFGPPDGPAHALRASTISLDSSALSEEENIALCAQLCAIAREAGLDLTLEMESGVDDGLTPPEVATRLVRGLESVHPGRLALWAPGVGTRHGFAREGFPSFSTEAIRRNRDLASGLCGRAIGIALHGSSGLAPEELGAAVASGVTKVNWSSESLLHRSRAAGAYWRDHARELDALSPQFKAHAMDDGVSRAVAQAYIPQVEARIRLLGGEHRARACLAQAGLSPGAGPVAAAPAARRVETAT